MKRINYTLMYGSINRDLRLDYIFTIDDNPENKYRTIITKPESPTIYIRPSYALSITEGFERPHLFLPGPHIRPVFDMLSKTVKATSEKLMALFPNVNKPEFDIDQTALQEFTIKDAVSVNGYTALPCVYVNNESECKPAIRVTNTKGEYVRIPLTDAIVMVKTYERTDLDTFGLTILSMYK